MSKLALIIIAFLACPSVAMIYLTVKYFRGKEQPRDPQEDPRINGYRAVRSDVERAAGLQ